MKCKSDDAESVIELAEFIKIISNVSYQDVSHLIREMSKHDRTQYCSAFEGCAKQRPVSAASMFIRVQV